MLSSVICKVGSHNVNRRRVWHDGINFRTKCTRCSAPLIRDHQKGWRPLDEERDLRAERLPHPRHA
ncbi:hypothetical protein ASS64_00115 [Erythrobacter sp. AP23]|nr:hypothetical protein ASS64_00115 [Erythrobacter sp. AP23]